MRLKVPKTTIEEELVQLINEGHSLAEDLKGDYYLKAGKRINWERENTRYSAMHQEWSNKADQTLLRLFPTPREANKFKHTAPKRPLTTGLKEETWLNLYKRTLDLVDELEQILQVDLPHYTELPIKPRIYVNNIDSFRLARDVDPGEVVPFLTNGRLELPESAVKAAFLEILSIPYEFKDSGVERDDIYSGNVIVNGTNRATAIMLKGPAVKGKMEIRDCGKQGNQLLKLCDAPAELFIVQFIGQISEDVIKDIDGKIAQMRHEGRQAEPHYCIIDGQDTARILYAYGKLPSS